MNIISVKVLLFLFILTGCLPEQTQRRALSEAPISSTESDDTTPVTSSENQFSEEVNFFQKSGDRTTATLAVFSNYDDSFMIRGNHMMSFLKDITKSYQSNFCIITKFNTVDGATNKNVLVLSAKIRSFFSSFLSTKEYFLQVEPNNQTVNQNDCLTSSLVSKVQTLYGSSNIAFSIEEVCPDCTLNVASQGFRIFDIFAEEKSQAKIGHLNISLIPEIGTQSGSTAVCFTNNNCTSLGFNCCLSGQCVNHGEVRSGVDTSSNEYNIALQLLSDRPELINNFSDIFYVCPLMVPGETGGGDDDEVDPDQQAGDLFTQLTQIYNCLNPVIDEFSVCALEFENANDLMASGPYSFEARDDDINFNSLNSSLSSNNIVQIDYGNLTLFKEALYASDSSQSLPTSIILGGGNDTLSSGQIASIDATLPSGATSDILTLYYKVDGTCEKLGSSLARCTKYYVQGQNSSPVARSSDHASGSQTFRLPSYADTSFNVIVEVGGTKIPQGTDTWSLSGTSIVFDADEFPIYDNQNITITYFASANVDKLTSSKEAVQSILDIHCACDPEREPCNLNPVQSEINGVLTTTSYVCIYPEGDSNAPLQETVYVSAKSVAHKFFDENGVNYDVGEASGDLEQEGSAFFYENSNYLKPNNEDQYIGFNEIYGTMNRGASSPQPPVVVSVDDGTQYDIFVDQGAFSTCLQCGSDYFSSMQKVFPNNFAAKGGGYIPDYVESRRQTNQGDFPADDFRFGRACFVPATMIPWTHAAGSDVATQRTNRLAAQHAFFANGYNKDWYGFDYGALIGSFDGVKWFAIGNERRVEAESNKLYLAVNAYFGDLTINNSFKVTISEMTAVINSGSQVTHDLDSDGAQCQRMHICDADEDCITQLGYDYTCQNVGSLNTTWPIFDSNGNEMVGSKNTSLLALVGGSNGESKRCVYRGAGAACNQLSANITTSNSYIKNIRKALHTCSANTQCAAVSDSKFNTKISRYAQTPKNQNAQSFITKKTDTFGLAARNLGRPFEYYGSELLPLGARTQFQTNNVDGLCVPGKDIENSATTQQLNYFSNSTREADKILNVGRTLSSTIARDPYYFSACPATDEEGNYTHFENIALDESNHQTYAIKNNMTSNSLILDVLSSKKLFNDEATLVEKVGYHKNTCLRAPGAKCFSDFECAPNNFISTKFKSVTNFNGEISKAEENFWEEELVCANTQNRFEGNTIYPNQFYELYEHHCCRETDKDFTFYSQPHLNPEFRLETTGGEPAVPGVNIDYDSEERYSRIHTIYDKLIEEPDQYPNMVVAAKQPTVPLTLTADKLRQYKTLHVHNERMCCTGHWVRNFSSGTNGNSGGHKQLPSKLQSFDISTFRALSWQPNNVPPINNFPAPYTPIAFGCQDVDYQSNDCEVRNILENSNYEKDYLTWLGKFELLGIPQVLIETNRTIFKPVGDGDSVVDDQESAAGFSIPIDKTIKNVDTDGTVNATYNGVDYYSAADYDNFEIGTGKMKKIFSENEFHCCIPTGVEVPSNTNDTECCTGKVAANSDGLNRCCLEDFTDLTVFTNRYVSSEGAFFGNQEVPDTSVDGLTGYIDKEEVIKMATTMCCSGKATTGIAIDNYFVPHVDPDLRFPGAFTRRFLYDTNLDNASEVGGVSKFEAGLKWNDHIYCVPDSFGDDDGGDTGGTGSGGTEQ